MFVQYCTFFLQCTLLEGCPVMGTGRLCFCDCGALLHRDFVCVLGLLGVTGGYSPLFALPTDEGPKAFCRFRRMCATVCVFVWFLVDLLEGHLLGLALKCVSTWTPSTCHIRVARCPTVCVCVCVMLMEF